MIEAKLSLVERASPKPPPVSRRWSFYTASVLASSNYAREVRVRLRLKSFGPDGVHNAGDWVETADACVSKDMAATADRSVV